MLTVILAGQLMVGAGLMVIVNCIGVPVQVTPLFVYDATTLKVEVIGEPLELVAVNDGTLPVPEVTPKPISGTGTVLLHENVAPVTLLPNTTEGTTAPAQ